MADRKVTALKAVISKNCRQTHGPMGAFDEAARRGDVPVFNLVLEVEYPSN